MKRSPMRRYAPVAKLSAKAVREHWKVLAVYAEVDRRSEGRCEWTDNTHPMLSQDSPVAVRCGWRATDHHHTQKPRRSHHTAALVIHLCRSHHERCDWPYARGRASIVPLGDGRFVCGILNAPTKFAARGQG